MSPEEAALHARFHDSQAPGEKLTGTVRPRFPIDVTFALRALAWGWWTLSGLLDRIPGFTDATEAIYNEHLEKERHGDA
jgi:hypothetical protein